MYLLNKLWLNKMCNSLWTAYTSLSVFGITIMDFMQFEFDMWPGLFKNEQISKHLHTSDAIVFCFLRAYSTSNWNIVRTLIYTSTFY